MIKRFLLREKEIETQDTASHAVPGGERKKKAPWKNYYYLHKSETKPEEPTRERKEFLREAKAEILNTMSLKRARKEKENKKIYPLRPTIPLPRRSWKKGPWHRK